MTQLKVGIIGCGGIANYAHLPGYARLADKVQLVAFCDTVEQRALDAAAKYGAAQSGSGAERGGLAQGDVPHTYTDYRQMLESHDLDIVSVCTPNISHAQLAIDALRSGAHVLCEKPPAMTLAEAEEMRTAAQQTGKKLAFGFHYRFAPEVQALKSMLTAGEFGQIYAATATAVRRRGIPGWGVFTNKELQGGGALIDIGVHMIDLALYLMDFPEPASALAVSYAEIGNKPGVGLMGQWNWQEFQVEDMARGMVTFEGGASLQFEAAFAANVEVDDTMQVNIMGAKAGAEVFPLHIFREEHGILTNTTGAYIPETNYHGDEIEHFVDCVLEDRTPISTPDQAVAVQKIISGLYASAQDGSPVTL